MLTTEPSEFAQALASLLDDTGLYNRDEWARLLGVPARAVDRWVTDQTLPRAEMLGLILDALRASRGVPQEPIVRFDALAERPALEVSPNGERMRPTVRAYLQSASIASLGLALRTMSERERALALCEGSWPPVGA